MNENRNKYENPLLTRYASAEMSQIFSPQVKFSTWRQLWIALAEAEKELGLDINDQQIDELKKYQNDINFDLAEAREKLTRHDVMAHVYAYGEQAPTAKPIIHLGATSAYVGDNADIIIMKNALSLLRTKLLSLIKNLSDFALKYKEIPTLGFTHFQPAQLTTVGKRASLWLQDFYLDYLEIKRIDEDLPLLGVKGTTGTAASFLELFDGDTDKVKKLEQLVAGKIGIDKVIDVSGQTYTRKIDYTVLSALSGIAQSAHKMTNDIRLLQNLKEIEEPFEKTQIGSSAMAYKRNPMRSERVASLSRYVINLAANAADTAATQWFERTLDDSANKRISVPESFLGCDSIIDICRNITNGLVVNEKVIHTRIMSELPFMMTENILMKAVKKGGDRQDLHERIRLHSMDAAYLVKQEGKPNDLLDRIENDPTFDLNKNDIEELSDPSLYIGCSSGQVEDFVNDIIKPILEKENIKDSEVELKV